MIASEQIEGLVQRILQTPAKERRRVVALVGAPASGKSTMADALSARLNAAGEPTVVLPMDGFHLDNRLLDKRGLRARKGAPETFDAAGLVRLVKALGTEDTLPYPLFDRSRDLAIAAAGCVEGDTRTVLVEGNYLLLDRPIWRELHGLWDLSILLDVPLAELERRLLDRWTSHGLCIDLARLRCDGNDLPNARLVMGGSVPADVLVGN